MELFTVNELKSMTEEVLLELKEKALEKFLSEHNIEKESCNISFIIYPKEYHGDDFYLAYYEGEALDLFIESSTKFCKPKTKLDLQIDCDDLPLTKINLLSFNIEERFVKILKNYLIYLVANDLKCFFLTQGKNSPINIKTRHTFSFSREDVLPYMKRKYKKLNIDKILLVLFYRLY